MSRVLVVADLPWVRNEVHASLTDPGLDLLDHDDPVTAAQRAHELGVDAAIVDLQLATMGGMAVTRDIRGRADLAGTPHIPVVMLLDRVADAFLAKRAGAIAWVTKPFGGHELAIALHAALSVAAQQDPGGDGGGTREDDGVTGVEVAGAAEPG